VRKDIEDMMERARLRDERGIALVMAIGVMFVMSLVLASIIGFTSANNRSANRQNADQQAFHLAEAGVNNSIAVLQKAYGTTVEPFVDYYSPAAAGRIDPASLLPPRTSTYDGRTVTWSGTYCLGQNTLTCSNGLDYGVWRLTATASVPNPTGPGAAPVTRTVKAKIQVVLPDSTPAVSDLWNWIYAGGARSPRPTCDMTISNTSVIESPLYVVGNLCLMNNQSIRQPVDAGGNPVGQENRLVVGGFLRFDHNGNFAGTTSNPLQGAHIVDQCTFKGNDSGNTWNYRTCGPDEKVFVAAGKLHTTMPDPLVVPPPVVPDDMLACPVGELCIDLDAEYLRANPGPRNPCQVVSGTPPMFDNNLARDKSVPAIVNLTPNASYTCRTVSGGEISWDLPTKVLKVSKPMFIDGSVEIAGGHVAKYEGRSTIYVSGTLSVKSTSLCAVRNAAGTDCDMTAWNPNVEASGSALAFVVMGNRSNGGLESTNIDGSTANVGMQVKGATFQGLVYARNVVEILTSGRIQGPIITPRTIIFGQSTDGTFPPISILPTGAPGTPLPPPVLGPIEDLSG
jgi:Tfp pilus assembly protein PilX